jgi:hypothetical protein
MGSGVGCVGCRFTDFTRTPAACARCALSGEVRRTPQRPSSPAGAVITPAAPLSVAFARPVSRTMAPSARSADILRHERAKAVRQLSCRLTAADGSSRAGGRASEETGFFW